jgi:hypothetical protein
MANPKEKASQPKEPQAEQAQASVSESPAEQTEEWVFTLNSGTGEIVKAERVDKTSGQRQELSDDEYAALSGYGDPTAYYAAQGYDPSAAAYDPNAHALHEAGYYQGLADYEAAVQCEAAYYQGLADYEAAVNREAAYYQGMADYEAMLG